MCRKRAGQTLRIGWQSNTRRRNQQRSHLRTSKANVLATTRPATWQQLAPPGPHNSSTHTHTHTHTLTQYSTNIGMFSALVQPPISIHHCGAVKWCSVTLGVMPRDSRASNMSRYLVCGVFSSKERVKKSEVQKCVKVWLLPTTTVQE